MRFLCFLGSENWSQEDITGGKVRRIWRMGKHSNVGFSHGLHCCNGCMSTGVVMVPIQVFVMDDVIWRHRFICFTHHRKVMMMQFSEKSHNGCFMCCENDIGLGLLLPYSRNIFGDPLTSSTNPNSLIISSPICMYLPCAKWMFYSSRPNSKD